MKLLMIANSFGVNLQQYAHDIAKVNNFDLDIYVLYIGGCSLETHAQNIKNNEATYELFSNGKTTNKFISIKDALLLNQWDYVSLQQASHFSGIEKTYYPYFEIIYNFVKELSPTSEIVFHQTWAYSSTNLHRFNEVKKQLDNFNFTSPEEMKKSIDFCYKKICTKFDIKIIILSGDIIQKAEKNGLDVYDEYGFHLNNVGCYLIGLNLIRKLMNFNIKNIYVPNELNEKDCAYYVQFINGKEK